MRLIKGSISNKTGQVLVLSVVRNEQALLPFFVEHYRELGVNGFIFVDNCSSDHTVDYLCSLPDAIVFSSKERYDTTKYGVDLITELLDRFGHDNWCIIADADEQLVYPHCETVSLPALCNYLEMEGATCMFSFLLELYSSLTICDTHCPHYGKLQTASPFFDPDSHKTYFDIPDYDYQRSSVKKVVAGGVRERVFGFRPWLNKASLIKYSDSVKIDVGCHTVEGVRLSQLEGVVLHFKFFNTFIERVKEESIRKQHAAEGFDYKQYQAVLDQQNDLSLYNGGSTRFSGSQQLLKLGLIRCTDDYHNYANHTSAHAIPQ